MEKIAVFDLDGTLTRGDTMWRFFRHVCGRAGFCVKLVKAMPHLAGYALGLRSAAGCKLDVVNLFLGDIDAAVLESAAQSFAGVVDGMLREGAAGYMSLLKGKGYRIVLCTASASLWVGSWAARNVDTLVCTELKRRGDGKFVYATPNCKGAEKNARLSLLPEFASENVYIEVYGDSESDRDMMRMGSVSYYRPDFVRLMKLRES